MNFPEKLGVPEYEFRLIFGRTKIDYDNTKEATNRRKHKYSLESAVHYFERLLLPIPHPPFMSSDVFYENDEVRHMHMSIDDDNGEVVFFVTTMREDETVRIISFRRANEKECETFRQHTGYNRVA